VPDYHPLDPLPEEIPEYTPPTPDRPPAWIITDDRTADWALRRIAAEQAQQDDDTQTALAEIDRWQQWATERHQARQRSIERLTAHLRGYYEQLKQAGKLGKRRSYPLPHGTLKERTTMLRWDYNDEDLIPWARAHGLVRIEERPDWSAIKPRLKPMEERIGAPAVDMESGEILECIRIERLPEATCSVELHDEDTHAL
jgi:hypothetical protein